MDKKEEPDFSYIYIIRCVDDSLYTGITKDVKRRMEEHYYHKKQGAKYTKSRQARELVMVWETTSWSAAAVLEHYIKSLTRAQKLKLIETPDSVNLKSEDKLKGNHYTPLSNLSDFFPSA